MKAERWEEIKRLFDLAREQEPERRGEFLREACGGDESLRSDVESMLARQAETGDFLEVPAMQAEAQALAMDLQVEMVGKKLGPYEILALIGAGGMGQVYKAQDTRLDRLVAIKISKEEFSERFEREARAVAALNHPHICTLYDVGTNYLVMEYIEGTPLAGPLPTKKVFEYAAQILDALEAAHEKGVIHRDLKPSNMLVTKQGIKLLDFGLAKVNRQQEERVLSQEETDSLPLTRKGMVLGTPAYMAPEQWEGRPADARSDIYAFGCVLYEMVTGKRADRERMPVRPAAMEQILKRCLARDPAGRWQSAGELRRDLRLVPQRRKRAKLAVLGGVAFAILIASAFFWPRTHAAPLTDKDVLVLSEFTNSTGDTEFDGTLRVALATQLEESPFLKILGDEEMREHLRMMNRPPGEHITDEIAREICLREGNKATIGGSITKLGSNYAISLKAVNCQTGETLARQQEEAEDKEHVLRAVAAAAAKMRAKLGESLSSIEKHEGLPGDVTTASLEALQAFALAREKNATEGHLAAIPFSKRATEIDPNFASAWEQLGNAYYYGAGDQQRQIECMKKAFALVDRVSERERLRISGLYYMYATFEYDKAANIWALLMHNYPRWPIPHNSLGLYYLNAVGELEKAAEEFRAALGLQQGNAFYTNLMAALTALGRFDEAKAAAETWRRELPKAVENAGYHTMLRIVGQLEGDSATVEKENQWFASKPQALQAIIFQANDAQLLGRFRRADALIRRAIELARKRNPGSDAVGILIDRAGRDAVLGKCGEALRYVRQVPTPTLPLVRNRQIAEVLALCGESQRAETLVNEIMRQYPDSTYWRTNWLPRIRAAAALYGNQPAEALDQLQFVASDLRSEVIRMRAQAYLGLGKGREAASEFQTLLNREPRNPLFRVGLARGLALTGDIAKAKKAYEDFFVYWKDADHDAPLLIAARKEYAALH